MSLRLYHEHRRSWIPAFAGMTVGAERKQMEGAALALPSQRMLVAAAFLRTLASAPVPHQV